METTVTDRPPPLRPRKHGITITRVFDAPRERVWEQLTEPEHFADWFGGPQSEVPVASVSMDARPGGAWRCTMFAGPDRRENPLARGIPGGAGTRAARVHALGRNRR